jgi:hypothetical protein
MEEQLWVKTLLKIIENPVCSKKKPQIKYDLNEIAFQKIKSLERDKETISFCKLRTYICKIFSIKKEDLMKLLKRFESEGKIIFVKQRGIKIC